MAACDWSALPDDILRLILARLSLVDYIRFGGVCLSWNRAVPEKRSAPRPRTLWLMLPGRHCHNDDARDFVSISSNKADELCRTHLPELRGHVCIGASDGYLITVEASTWELHVKNPLTGAQINLPSFTTFPNIVAVERDPQGHPVGYTVKNLSNSRSLSIRTRQPFFVKAILQPSTNGAPPMVAVIYDYRSALAVATAGDESWTLVAPEWSNLQDIVFHNGQLYAVGLSGGIMACDVKNRPSHPTNIAHHRAESCGWSYLVESTAGRLLHVWMSVRADYACEFLVHEMASDGGERVEVSSMRSLGGDAMVLGENCSLCLSTRDFDDLRGDCIYFCSDRFGYSMSEQTTHVGVFKLQDGSTQWILPRDPEVKWPPQAFFFIPSLS